MSGNPYEPPKEEGTPAPATRWWLPVFIAVGVVGLLLTCCCCGSCGYYKSGNRSVNHIFPALLA